MRKVVHLGNRRSLIAAYSFAKTRTNNWMVFIPQSSADFHSAVRGDFNWLLGAKLAAHYNLLAINKPGLGPSRTDHAKFEESFRRPTRVADALLAMKRVIPKDAQIFLIGYSEGAYLAPSIAARDKRVRSIAIIGGGTRGWLKEELSNGNRWEKPEIRRVIREIHKRPYSMERWQEFSFATWYSYRHDDTLQALRKLKIPVLAILGARDRTIDLKTALADLRRLKRRKNIQIRLFKSCGHSFTGHWRLVRKALDEYL